MPVTARLKTVKVGLLGGRKEGMECDKRRIKKEDPGLEHTEVQEEQKRTLENLTNELRQERQRRVAAERHAGKKGLPKTLADLSADDILDIAAEIERTRGITRSESESNSSAGSRPRQRHPSTSSEESRTRRRQKSRRRQKDRKSNRGNQKVAHHRRSD